jgi:hypothetical protein
MGDLKGIRGERALVLILNHYMTVKSKIKAIIIN